jgi:uncharacterized membrane protein
MVHEFKKYPVDIILFLLWSVIILPIILLDMNEMIRIILGLPFLLFIPGYLLIFILFPMKQEYNGINKLERIGLSFGFSIALVSLLGLVLNFTPWGIQLASVLISQLILIECFGFIALYRWSTTHPEKRQTISLDFSQFRYSKKSEKILTIFVFLSLFLAVSSIVYIIVQPKSGEAFTDFYLLPPTGNTIDYPRDIIAGQDTNIILGLINHEYKTMSYTIEVWLINETTLYNESTKTNETIYNHAWFMNETTVILDHTEITNEKNLTKKWQYNYTFKINTIGHYKLAFLLFTTPSEIYDPGQDYKDSIHQKINNAYREVHLWLYVG